MTLEQQQEAKKGIFLAISAYTMWGVAPIYFKLLGHVSPLEILSHRIIWSFFLLAGLLHFSHQWRHVVDIFQSKIKLGYLLITALLIGGNWLIFIWAINANHMLDASLGYYINPILNVFLGMLFLGERLRKLQWFAVLLAMIGVAIQLVVFGSLPVVALVLATTFGLYGLLRKKVGVGAQSGLFIETLFLLPVAALYLFMLADTPTSHLSNNDWSLNLLLISAGIITTLPLLCFTGAATRLKLSTLGFFQYIGPSLMFLLAVLVYGEAFSADKAITFVFIWGALIAFSYDGLTYKRYTTRIVTE
ncbi:EamA family transporter RarD [Vibrio sp. V31_P5A7T61]|uniref:EamA family transporter RarD n=1 Tax=Vibrio TaxID=662 RepID=UPI001372377A|nr:MULTISPECIES: EamA family transporter RarD [unclassified Vibrio]NAW62183.1 EamA family transporter RarD [Vibrio sp. V31_P5A7T61]NAX01033.1 EamA family transporter RarD [Vibrio sp. V34_P3A8T189]NAX06675.1 EamA family transporter RarD [Vibrio sp. V40_P2S30T141]NAX62960.1 EamA family transporter RarD [Vibrio sp. V32_P6A28T40]